MAAFQLSRRSVRSDPSQLRSAEDVATIARGELAGARRERLIVVICDSANHVKKVVTVSEGALARSIVGHVPWSGVRAVACPRVALW
ncbi:JAB domain-containing protein [Mycobacterium avium]|uniref:JAB domain-containing protein n=1 Tax=Mycobacterium avium TaxID=1764 RepID=UPI001E61E874|nr:JAB domain-containing protein [Mycobacterium avium]